MTIPNRFYQFENFAGLFIVSGSQQAVICIADHHLFNKVDACVVKRPKYSDNEGHVEMHGSGNMLRVGGTPVSDKQQRVARYDFLQELKKSLQKISEKHTIDHIFLFAPKRMHHHIVKLLPPSLKEKTINKFDGNYVNHDPKELFEQIKIFLPALSNT